MVSSPNQNIYEVPDHLDLNEAASRTNSSCIARSLNGREFFKKPLSECRTLVQGAGAIGLLCSLILSKIKGNKNIVMSDPNLRLTKCKIF